MEDAARVTQMPVRDDLDEVHGAQSAEHPALDDDRPAVLEHAHLAPILVLVRRRRLLVRARRGLVHGTRPRCTIRYGSERS